MPVSLLSIFFNSYRSGARRLRELEGSVASPCKVSARTLVSEGRLDRGSTGFLALGAEVLGRITVGGAASCVS